MSYQHVDTEVLQEPKRHGDPCGDAVWVGRTAYHTTLVLADGIGSGIHAYIAAQMNTARLAELLQSGASLHDAFMSLVATLSGWRDHKEPFAAFTLARVLNDGTTTVLAYEMPPPLFIDARGASALESSTLVVPVGLAFEYHCRLRPAEGLLLVSDGIVQAGMGGRLEQGWTNEALSDFLNQWPRRGLPFRRLARDVMQEARNLDGALPGDDKTVVIAHARMGSVVRVLTGPPKDPKNDASVVEAFMNEEGRKVVCGATTAEIVSRQTGITLEMDQDMTDFTTPPRSSLRGVDLVSEGAVTLIQAFNLLDADVDLSQDKGAASELAGMLRTADCVHFVVGEAVNPANEDIAFRKQGILPRSTVVPLIAGKLEKMGKLVTVEKT
jgi:hypothetical protein